MSDTKKGDTSLMAFIIFAGDSYLQKLQGSAASSRNVCDRLKRREKNKRMYVEGHK